MRKSLQCAAWVLPLMLTACFHRHHKPTPNQALAPLETTQVDNSPSPAPPPLVPAPQPAATAAATTQPAAPATAPKPQEKPPRRIFHHKKPETKPVEEAANPTPEVSAIGQLSPGDPSDLRVQIESSLNSIDQALKKLNRQVSDQDKKTLAQIREFLKQARAALASGDVDGAHTLALKAKVLLDEITR
ncbi:MAG TPA: hypothetical protein VND90_10945 [Terracidiphilus sp.]|nr:hypothetical protein [Terracidiphilus sp.]